MKIKPINTETHTFKTLIEKDTPFLIMENGGYSDW